MALQTVLYAGAALVVYVLVQDLIENWLYARKAKKHGCSEITYTRSFPFGIRRLFMVMGDQKNNRGVERMRSVLLEGGHKTVRAQEFGRTVFKTCEPENIKAMLATQFNDFEFGPLRYTTMRPLLGDGVFTLDGSGWQHSRALLRPQFAKEQVSRVHELEGPVKNLMRIIDRDGLAPGGSVEIQDLFFKLVLDTATDYLFGESTNTLLEGKVEDTRAISGKDFGRLFNEALEHVVTRFMLQKLIIFTNTTESTRVFGECKAFVDYYVKRVLDAKAQGKELGGDKYFFLNELTKQTTDPIVMRDQALNILLAGRDTTSGLLSFTFALLVRHKDVFYKLREEVLDSFGTTPDSMDFHTLRRCEYLKNVINEVLRLYPVVPNNSRLASRDTTLPVGGGPDGRQSVFVPKGAPVFYSVDALHRDKDIWGPDANEFKPERWNQGKSYPWQYIPFNGGPRICLGQQLALTEASYVIARLLQTYSDINGTPEELAQPIKIERKLTAMLPQPGLHITFTKA
ncbi:hypothetical protein TRVA0_020S01156 [Trichomonascus vanleenenianus]|uniref:cytochrome P450 n=1 Tax=Trichomonascus vanleenenianus TaxID=2268995 RepID=UPI003ECB6F8D